MTSEDTVHVDLLLQTSSAFRDLLHDFANSNGVQFSLKRVGLLLRRARHMWLEALYLCIVEDLPSFEAPLDPNSFDTDCAFVAFSRSSSHKFLSI